MDKSNSSLFVEFYTKASYNAYASEAQGRPIFEDVDYIRIQVPGDATTRIERPVRSGDSEAYPLQWAAYRNNERQAQTGTPVSEWPAITRSQAEMLISIGFHTVEQVAAASDQHISNAGMGAFGIREKARAFLDSASGTADIQAMAAANRRQLDEIAALKRKVSELSEAAAPPARRRGRPSNRTQAEAA